MIVPVILSGGSGTRLWPLSRELHPKQFLPLVNSKSLLQDTVERLNGLPSAAAPIIVCNQEHRFLVAEQLRERGLRSSATILEPVGRNTAPAAAVAALHAMREGDDPVLLLLPSDHVVTDSHLFRSAVSAAVPQAMEGRLITFGVRPTGPETGYGYIRAGASLGAANVSLVERFVEKPDRETAESYVASGEYVWNSGMFLFRASDYLSELQTHAPDILDACRASLDEAAVDLEFIRLGEDAFGACRSDSIDYAVFEKTKAAAVVTLEAGWSDVGSWAALWDVGTHSADGNVARGDVVVHNVRNSYLHSEDRLIAAVGLENMVVVETADAVLIANKDSVQDVKTLVTKLKDSGRSEGQTHRKVYRPWGAYDSVDTAERFQVKHITVKPGATLSLQMHHHRAEHWIVVRGTARVTRGEENFLITENQSTYIPLGTKHRLENPGTIPLEIIEVQSGSYLGEDDIVRFEDVYGRQDKA